MKLVCIIDKLAPTVYFVNTIHQYHPVSLVIEEKPSDKTRRQTVAEQFINSVKSYGIYETLGTVASTLCSRSQDHRRRMIHDRYFQNAWHDIQSDIAVIQVENINAPQVLDRLREEKPDIMLDHGTSIVHNRILETADLALNLHWGLSPYYRGTHCTEWALINWDPYNIGVTIHKLVKKVDGGEIVAQQRAHITPEDTAYSIDMQLSYLGTGLVCKILDRLKSSGPLRFISQSTSPGFLTLDRQWNHYCRKQVQYIEKNAILGEMLRHPSRRERLPIIELDECSDDNPGSNRL